MKKTQVMGKIKHYLELAEYILVRSILGIEI